MVSDIDVFDAKFKSISLRIKKDDTLFSSYSVSTGIQSNSLCLFDNNFDGTFDYKVRLRPPLCVSVNINSNWYDLIRTNRKQYVQVDGVPQRVAATNGIWHFVMNQKICCHSGSLNPQPLNPEP